MLAAMDARLALAGMHTISVPVLVAVSVLLGLVAAALTLLFVPVLALTITAGIVATALPVVIVNWRARNRRKANRVLWPDVVDHLVSAVRAGLALPDSVATLAHHGPAASREPFAVFERDYRATGNFSVCIDHLKLRLADPVADRILETLRMSREVGGSDLTTVLRNLSAYLRQEAAIRSEVEARQSWVLNAARLGVASPWIILLLLASRPEAALAYNTPAGGVIIVSGLAVTIIAYRCMIALGRLPDERRWFQ
ncbi:MAG: type secretion system protein [Homoserinimonas sp.]|nr:type secretion system protein [Homoserinimonas sp.]